MSGNGNNGYCELESVQTNGKETHLTENQKKERSSVESAV